MTQTTQVQPGSHQSSILRFVQNTDTCIAGKVTSKRTIQDLTTTKYRRLENIQLLIVACYNRPTTEKGRLHGFSTNCMKTGLSANWLETELIFKFQSAFSFPSPEAM